MPTHKQVSRIKQEWIDKRNKAIDSKINVIQTQLYDSILPDVISLAKENKDAKNLSGLRTIEKTFKSAIDSGLPDVMKQTVTSAKSLGDLNQMYFSTLLDSNRLEEIRTKTNSIIDKRLGVDSNGKLIKNGFVDKALMTESLQKDFIKQIKSFLTTNPDTQLLKDKLKTFIITDNASNGFLQQYYNTFASNILNNIDRSNGLVYADELDLQHFYYSGGLIKTSRSFCLQKNGKIFTRSEAQKWKDSAFIKKMYGDNINDYNPLTDMGGYGCLHVPDWITSELAKAHKQEQNKIATERNKNFKDRNSL